MRVRFRSPAPPEEPKEQCGVEEGEEERREKAVMAMEQTFRMMM